MTYLQVEIEVSYATNKNHYAETGIEAFCPGLYFERPNSTIDLRFTLSSSHPSLEM